MIRKLFCWMGRCLRCRPYETREGIGGRCIDCGKVHGWVTREELRRYVDNHPAILALTQGDQTP